MSRPRHFLLIGESGVGKTVALNNLTGEKHVVSDGVAGAAVECQRGTRNGCRFIEMVGLSEGDSGSVHQAVVFTKFLHFIQENRLGLSAIFLIVASPRVTKSMQQNYHLFVRHVTQGKVPCYLFINKQEFEDYENQFETNVNLYSKAGFEFAGGFAGGFKSDKARKWTLERFDKVMEKPVSENYGLENIAAGDLSLLDCEQEEAQQQVKPNQPKATQHQKRNSNRGAKTRDELAVKKHPFVHVQEGALAVFQRLFPEQSLGGPEKHECGPQMNQNETSMAQASLVEDSGRRRTGQDMSSLPTNAQLPAFHNAVILPVDCASWKEHPTKNGGEQHELASTLATSRLEPVKADVRNHHQSSPEPRSVEGTKENCRLTDSPNQVLAQSKATLHDSAENHGKKEYNSRPEENHGFAENCSKVIVAPPEKQCESTEDGAGASGVEISDSTPSENKNSAPDTSAESLATGTTKTIGYTVDQVKSFTTQHVDDLEANVASNSPELVAFVDRFRKTRRLCDCRCAS